MSDMRPQGIQNGPESAYENDDLSVKSVINSMAIVLTSTLVVMASMYGMFNFLNHQFDKRDAEVEAKRAMFATTKLPPPEPRLLPNPYTDEHDEVKLLDDRLKASGLAGTQKLRDGEKHFEMTPDRLPWDKRNEEIEEQDVETNAKSPTGKTIPVAAAMALDAGGSLGDGTPGVMPWQGSYPSRTAGTKDRSMNVTVGQKRVQAKTFDDRPKWESPDEKFNADSTGGMKLGADGAGSGWSR